MTAIARAVAILSEGNEDMDERTTKQEKLAKPHATFDAPQEVVIDPVLSKRQKIDVLDALEQDARQLSIAASEGMTGGEPTGLREVLDAKDTLALPPVDQAYGIVLKDLQAKAKAGGSGEGRAAAEKALAALVAEQRPAGLRAADAAAASASSGEPAPGSAAERELEERLEELDP
jgi:hypothetical protein